MDWDKRIFTVAVSLIGAYSVYDGNETIAGMCLGIMGAILRPGMPKDRDDTLQTITINEQAKENDNVITAEKVTTTPDAPQPDRLRQPDNATDGR